MIGRIFSVFLNSYAESYRLEERYRRITTRLGWITVAVSCLALITFMYYSRLMLGIPLEGGSMEGMRLKMLSWIVLIILVVPFAFFAGMVLVNGAFGFVMFMLGKFSWRQAIDFSWRARYPDKWYQQNT